MVNKCCVSGCRSNYRTSGQIGPTPYVPTFSFPKDEDLRNEWIRRINRDNLKLTKNTVLCIKHFEECDLNHNLSQNPQKPDFRVSIYRLLNFI